jgi:hypothetical protein
MKALHATILLSISLSNFSLHSMNIIRQKTHSSLTHRTIKHSVLKKNLISTKQANPFLKKAKQFFDMSDINNIASAGNIVAAGATGNPLYLLLIIPQILQRASTYLHMGKSAELKTFEKDVQFLLSKSIINRQFDNLLIIDWKTKSLTETSDIQQLKRLNLLAEHNSKISELKKEKSEVELSLIKESGYLFNMNNTPKLLNQAKKYLEATKVIDCSSLGVNAICIMGLMVPLVFTAFEGSNLDFLCTALNTIICSKNVHSSGNQNELNGSLQNAIEISKIKNLKNNQPINE